jgi:hypothetical protein
MLFFKDQMHQVVAHQIICLTFLNPPDLRIFTTFGSTNNIDIVMFDILEFKFEISQLCASFNSICHFVYKLKKSL